MPGTLYTFKSLTHYGKITISEQLKANLIAFFNWGLLEVGAFTNVRIPNTTIRGGEAPYKLRRVEDPNFASGRVYESQRMNWVYESGINYGTKPIQVSGVFVNGIFQPGTGVGPYAHFIDYPNGRVIFNSPVTSGAVTCEYSYKRVNVLDCNSQLFRTAQDSAFNTADPNIPVGSGDWNRLAATRVQLPMVAIEVTPNVSFSPKQIGGGQYKHQTISFHVVAESDVECNKICDIIVAEKERTLMLFDVNSMAQNNTLPLLSSGNLNPNGVNNYRNILLPVGSGGYQWKLCEFEDSDMRQIGTANPKLYYGLATLRIKVDMPEL